MIKKDIRISISKRVAVLMMVLMIFAFGLACAKKSDEVREEVVRKFVVTFDAQNGEKYQRSVSDGSIVSRPEDPIKDMYEFIDWYESDLVTEFAFDSKPIVRDITIYAKWNRVAFVYNRVVFDSLGGEFDEFNDGELSESKDKLEVEVIDDGQLARPRNPKKSGFAFSGWFRDESFEDRYDFNVDIVSEDMVLYAKWVEEVIVVDEVTITFDSHGGSEVETKTVEKGSIIEEPHTSREHFVFKSWYRDSAFLNEYDFSQPVMYSTKLHARWEAIQHTVTFDSRGGSEVESQVVDENELVVEPQSPTKANNTFEGWYIDEEYTELWDFENDRVEREIEMYAKWEEKAAIMYRVEFDGNGGKFSNGSETKEIEVQEGSKLSQPSGIYREGYELSKWYRDRELSIEWNFSRDVVRVDITLYAGWVEILPNEYIVVFDSRGGSEVASETVVEGGKVTRPKDPTMKGNDFVGWYIDGTNEEWDFSNDTVQGNTILYAKWEKYFVVTFDANGGELQSNGEVKVREGDRVERPVVNPPYGQIDLLGWQIVKDDDYDNIVWDFASVVTQDMTLTAMWANYFNVKIDPNNGTKEYTKIIYEGKMLGTPTDSNPGFRFKEYQERETGDIILISTLVYSDLELVIVWE